MQITDLLNKIKETKQDPDNSWKWGVTEDGKLSLRAKSISNKNDTCLSVITPQDWPLGGIATITRTLKPSEPSEPSEIREGCMSVNKLYRIRFKAFPSFSNSDIVAMREAGNGGRTNIMTKDLKSLER